MCRYDTVLTSEGQAQAAKLASVVQQLDPKPEVLVVSPLTRALQTAELAFADMPELPRHVEPLARERVYHASDIGSFPQHLSNVWPQYKFDHLSDVWWYCRDPRNPHSFDPEPADVFLERMEQLRMALIARPEACIALVSHWGVLQALTGIEFGNCELRSMPASSLQCKRLSDVH